MSSKIWLFYIFCVALLVIMVLYLYGIAHWDFYYPCSNYNSHNSTMCIHCYSYNFKCVCQQFELYHDFDKGMYDCNICPPYKSGDLWFWLNCGNLTKQFVVG